MLLMVETGIRGEIWQTIHWYGKPNNKFMKDYDKNKESSYFKYWDVNDLYGWAMSLRLPVNKFEWIQDTSQFNKDFIKNYDEESDEGSILKKLQELHNDLPFLPQRMKTEKFEKVFTNLHDQTKYVIHIRNLKETLNPGLILKKVHRVFKFNQKAWLKPYVDMNTNLR